MVNLALFVRAVFYYQLVAPLILQLVDISRDSLAQLYSASE
jgi:hypothetical protein